MLVHFYKLGLNKKSVEQGIIIYLCGQLWQQNRIVQKQEWIAWHTYILLGKFFPVLPSQANYMIWNQNQLYSYKMNEQEIILYLLQMLIDRLKNTKHFFFHTRTWVCRWFQWKFTDEGFHLWCWKNDCLMRSNICMSSVKGGKNGFQMVCHAAGNTRHSSSVKHST